MDPKFGLRNWKSLLRVDPHQWDRRSPSTWILWLRETVTATDEWLHADCRPSCRATRSTRYVDPRPSNTAIYVMHSATHSIELYSSDIYAHCQILLFSIDSWSWVVSKQNGPICANRPTLCPFHSIYARNWGNHRNWYTTSEKQLTRSLAHACSGRLPMASRESFRYLWLERRCQLCFDSDFDRVFSPI